MIHKVKIISYNIIYINIIIYIMPSFDNSRIFSQYLPTSYVDWLFMKQNNLKTDREYREFMKQHGQEILEKMRHYQYDCKCNSCLLRRNDTTTQNNTSVNKLSLEFMEL